MSKAVLISIQPHWCELIANSRKTVEVRKTRPKLEPPFKCYIYCTNKKPYLVWGDVFRGNWETEFTRLSGYNRKDAEEIWDVFNGHIMGEFVCDRIRDFEVLGDVRINDYHRADLQYSCLNTSEISAYIGVGGIGYGWHISNLEVYDTPKKIGDLGITRAPQSWCYVEDLEGGVP